MSDLISRKELIEALRKDRESVYSYVFCHTECQHEEELALDLEQFIENAPTVKAVPLKEAFRIIAGHSDYHGDSILSALKCITEGKEVKPIKPIEV